MITAKQDAIQILNRSIRDVGALVVEIESEEGYDEDYTVSLRRTAGWLYSARQYIQDANDYEIATPAE